MSPKWIIFLTTLWIIGSILGLALEGAYPGGEEQNVFNTLANSKALQATTLFGAVAGAFSDLSFFTALGSVLIWDFSFWDGTLEIVRWIIFLPITIGIVGSLLLAWIRGVGG